MLQSVTLQLGCHARNLTNELKLMVSLTMSTSAQSSDYSIQRRHYIAVLSGVSHVVNSIKIIAAMIDRSGFTSLVRVEIEMLIFH